jgi:uncharacterized phage protein gp47/JayE
MGITIDYEKGISVDDTATVRQSLVEAWESVFSDENATLNTESESPAGQIIDSQAVLVTAKDSELVELMNQFDPRKADGIFQEALAAIYFLTRKTAQPTVVECVCTGLQGTTIPAGSMIQNDDGYKLTSVGDVTIPASGSVNVEFQTVDVGAIPIPANSCNKIITVIAGWDTVANENAGVVGQLEESRTALETRRALSVAKNSHGSRLSLQGSIASIDGVLDCLVLENKSNTSVTIQGVSLISHSVAICVYGGTDEAIAEMIYNKLDAGCGTNGGTTVTYTSSDGVHNNYQIVRPAPTNLYVEVTINETTTTPATIMDDIKQAIVNDFNGLDSNSGNLRRGCGQTIYASSFSVALIKTAGVSDLVSIEIGRSAGTYTNSVVMDADEEPILTAENINVVMNPLS